MGLSPERQRRLHHRCELQPPCRGEGLRSDLPRRSHSRPALLPESQARQVSPCGDEHCVRAAGAPNRHPCRNGGMTTAA